MFVKRCGGGGILGIMHESFPSPESNKVERQQVVDALRLNGKDHPETLALLVQFVQQEEAIVEQHMEKRSFYHEAVASAIRNAELYFEAGYVSEAVAELEENLEIAFQANEQELFEKIEALLVQMRSEQ